jgi:hypothetical protein
LTGGQHRPICVYLVPEPGPIRLCGIPIHFSLHLRGHSPAHRRSGASLAGYPCNACVAPSCAGIRPLTVDPGYSSRAARAPHAAHPESSCLKDPQLAERTLIPVRLPYAATRSAHRRGCG